MDPMFGTFLFLFLIVFVINVIPAFMPASWIVLAVFAINWHLPVPWVVLVGVTASTLGRTVLYHISDRYIKYFLSKRQRKNMDELGEILNERRNIMMPLIVSFSLLPVPSNHIYIAAGMARFNLETLTASFFIGRLVNYIILVSGADLVAGNASDLVGQSVTSLPAIILQVMGIVILYLITMVSWRSLFRRNYRDWLKNPSK